MNLDITFSKEIVSSIWGLQTKEYVTPIGTAEADKSSCSKFFRQ